MSNCIGSMADPIILDDSDSDSDSDSDRKGEVCGKESRQSTTVSGLSESDYVGTQIAMDRADSKRRWDHETEIRADLSRTKRFKTENLCQRHEQQNDLESAVPIKIFTSELPPPDLSCPHVTKHCRTLRELIGLEGCDQNKSQIKWMAIFNYLIDFDHLLDTVPELISIPNLAVFYGHGEPQTWKQMNPGIHFQQLLPSDPPNSHTNPLGFKVPWGVHHTKMFLIGFGDGTLRVIIHTSNLLEGDVSLKAQGAYVQDFSLKAFSVQTSTSECQFEIDLVTYLKSYKYFEKRKWSGETEPSRSLCDELIRYNFASARVVLIYSTPGRSSLDQPKGYLKLSKAIRNIIPKGQKPTPIICQFSSIGSFNCQWLQEIVTSWDASQSVCKTTEELQRQLKLVYPTVNEIRESVEGYIGGGSVPGRRSNVGKPFLQPLYHRWSTLSKDLNPLRKPNNVPHCKTFYQISEDGKGMQWYCLTSHNLSKAAWGEIISARDERCFFTRHWELGVFVAPQMFGKNTLHPVGSFCADSQESCVELPLPFQLQPIKYSSSDRPWIVDGIYVDKDQFGRRSCIDSGDRYHR